MRETGSTPVRERVRERVHPPHPRLNGKGAAWVDITLHVSRLASLFTGHWFGVFFPRKIQLNNEGIRTQRIRSIIFPWQREEELVAFRRIFGIKHIKGMLWDSIMVTGVGDINTLEVHGLSKPDAQTLVRTIQKNI